MADDNNTTEVVDRRFLWQVFSVLRERAMARCPRTIPIEVGSLIVSYVLDLEPQQQIFSTMTWLQPLLPPKRNPAYTPPADGSSPFMRLPAELRRSIFATSLPDNNNNNTVVFLPRCQDNATTYSRPVKLDKRGQPLLPSNRIVDLMILNCRISGEVREMIYEERTFVIHVHEGLRDGGVEFLDAGRQPIQFKDRVEDPRFARFGRNDEFGFRRLQKIIIEIHPANESPVNRHTAINTYFMNLALCSLLERRGEKSERIKSLTIRFPNPQDATAPNPRPAPPIKSTEQYWWDPDRNKPRETSVHNLSNIELVLRPFAMLDKCHAVRVDLPDSLRHHQPTVTFVNALTTHMISSNGPRLEDDDLMGKIERARDAMEEYVKWTLSGTRPIPVEPLTDVEMMEDGAEWNEFADDKGRKRNLSPTIEECDPFKRQFHDRIPNRYGNSSMRQNGYDQWNMREQSGYGDWSTREQKEDEARMMQAAHDSLQDEEERMIQAAIRASLQPQQDPWSATVVTDLTTARVDTNGSYQPGRTTRRMGGALPTRIMPIRGGRQGPGYVLSSYPVSGQDSQIQGGWYVPPQASSSSSIPPPAPFWGWAHPSREATDSVQQGAAALSAAQNSGGAGAVIDLTGDSGDDEENGGGVGMGE